MKLQLILAGVCAIGTTLYGAVESRTANITGARGDRGKCTIEVEVDGAADVEIAGDRATIRTLQGQRANFRRFQCSDPLPRNPEDFRFTGVDGRGRQTLVADPRNNRGVAVVRIEDRQGGREGYTFDIEWRGNYPGGGYGQQGQRPGGYDRDRPPYGGGPGGGTAGAGQAVNVCTEEVRRRLRTDGFDDVRFFETRIDNGPGRNDVVLGRASARRGRRVDEFNFDCRVNLANGRVRDVNVNRR